MLKYSTNILNFKKELRINVVTEIKKKPIKKYFFFKNNDFIIFNMYLEILFCIVLLSIIV